MITANLFFNRIPNWDSYRQMVILPQLAAKLISEQGYDDTSPLMAYVNHGRWIVKCGCGCCEKVWEEGWMMCQSCFNARQGHKYRRTVFPKERNKIEMLLLQRPLTNRNWYPHEILTDLERENLEHKTELLEVC